LTPLDIERIFQPLARYRYLPAVYLRAIGGGSSGYMVDRLNLLSRRPNLYVRRPPQQRANAAANYRPLVYELSDRGLAALQQQGFQVERSRAPNNFAHELMTCQVMASFELGARETGAHLITWSDILKSSNLPDATRQRPKPYAIPVSTVVDGQRFDAHV